MPRALALLALVLSLVGTFGAFETLYWVPLETVTMGDALAIVLGCFAAGATFNSAARKLLRQP